MLRVALYGVRSVFAGCTPSLKPFSMAQLAAPMSDRTGFPPWKKFLKRYVLAVFTERKETSNQPDEENHEHQCNRMERRTGIEYAYMMLFYINN